MKKPNLPPLNFSFLTSHEKVSNDQPSAPTRDGNGSSNFSDGTPHSDLSSTTSSIDTTLAGIIADDFHTSTTTTQVSSSSSSSSSPLNLSATGEFKDEPVITNEDRAAALSLPLPAAASVPATTQTFFISFAPDEEESQPVLGIQPHFIDPLNNLPSQESLLSVGAAEDNNSTEVNVAPPNSPIAALSTTSPYLSGLVGSVLET